MQILSLTILSSCSSLCQDPGTHRLEERLPLEEASSFHTHITPQRGNSGNDTRKGFLITVPEHSGQFMQSHRGHSQCVKKHKRKCHNSSYFKVGKSISSLQSTWMTWNCFTYNFLRGCPSHSLEFLHLKVPPSRNLCCSVSFVHSSWSSGSCSHYPSPTGRNPHPISHPFSTARGVQINFCSSLVLRQFHSAFLLIHKK